MYTCMYMYMYLAVERGKCFTLSQSVFLRELMMRRGLGKHRESKLDIDIRVQ